MLSRQLWIVVALSGLFAACTDCGTPPASEPDAAVADAHQIDSAVADAQVADHATSDARRPDSALPDSAVSDTALADTVAADVATPVDGAPPSDGALPDAAAEDGSSPPDATMTDNGPAAPPFTSLLQHAADGTVALGAVQAVADLMSQGGGLKVIYDGWLLECTNAWILSDTLVSCQTWFPFAVADDGTHYNVDAAPEWWIATFNSNGITDHAQYLVESHTATRDETVAAALQWLGRPSRRKIYQADDSGTAVSGSLDHLIELARAGAPVTYGPLATATLLVTGGGTGLAVHDPTHVSIDSANGDYRIQDDSYHYFQWLNTSGYTDAARWFIGNASYISSSGGYSARHWFVEPGWQEVLLQDASGQVVHGSLAQLRAAASSGHSIRIELGQDLFYPCAAVTVDEAQATVACRAFDGWTWASGGNDVYNDGALQRDYRVAATTALVQTERYSIASATCT